MKILIRCNGNFFSSYGGGQVYVKNIVDEMIRQHMDIVLLSSYDECSGIVKREFKGKLLYEVNTKASYNQIKNIISEVNPDIIHGHAEEEILCSIGKELSIPVVVTAHHGGIICPAGTLMNDNDEICNNKVCHKNCLPCALRNIRTGRKLWYPFMKFLPEQSYNKLGEFISKKKFIPFITPIGGASLFIRNEINRWKSLAENASHIIAPSEAMADAMVRNGLNITKISVVPHGIPLPTEIPQYPDTNIIKFYYSGRICYIKGIHILLKAFSKINNRNVELHLIGGAVGKSEIRYMHKLKKEYGHDSRIIWHGKINPEEMFSVIGNMHVCVSVTICLEVFGLNIAEALATQKPVLASRCGGAEMQVKDGFNGWLIATNDARALQAKMEDIIAQPTVLKELSTNCKAIPIEQHIHDIYAVYVNVLNNYPIDYSKQDISVASI